MIHCWNKKRYILNCDKKETTSLCNKDLRFYRNNDSNKNLWKYNAVLKELKLWRILMDLESWILMDLESRKSQKPLIALEVLTPEYPSTRSTWYRSNLESRIGYECEVFKFSQLNTRIPGFEFSISIIHMKLFL